MPKISWMQIYSNIQFIQQVDIDISCTSFLISPWPLTNLYTPPTRRETK